jgi:hypothetical protein
MLRSAQHDRKDLVILNEVKDLSGNLIHCEGFTSLDRACLLKYS